MMHWRALQDASAGSVGARVAESKASDLKVRTLSAIVMLAVAGGALWAGGWVFTIFVAAIAAGLLWEWWGLISKFNSGILGRALWMLGGVVYIGGAFLYLWAQMVFRGTHNAGAYLIFGGVIATDIGAYFAGRRFGGKKLAPKISPNKTWSGLLGGIVLSSLLLLSYAAINADNHPPFKFFIIGIAGAFLAIIAQMGDLLESWMKRRANVKDSGKILPGHGGLLDRLDGYLAVLFVMSLISYQYTLWILYLVTGFLIGHNFTLIR